MRSAGTPAVVRGFAGTGRPRNARPRRPPHSSGRLAVARGLNHYLCETDPTALEDDEKGEFPPLNADPERIKLILAGLTEFFEQV